MVTVISAQDYDVWGHLLPNRSYNISEMKYDYTGKERDNETTYDYFGARYYDSRIANWTSIDPLLKFDLTESPYVYVSRNPLKYIDNDGRIKLPQWVIDEFPKFASFVRYELPTLLENEKIMGGLETWTVAKKNQILNDFKWNEGPTLDVKNISEWGSYNDEVDPEVINIRKILVQYFNDSESDDVDDVVKLFMGITILHEYTHYVNRDLEFYDPDSKIKKGKDKIVETGWMFEIYAFGKIIGSPDEAAKYLNELNKKSGSAKRYPTDNDDRIRQIQRKP